MNWGDERFVRIYVRDTIGWLLWSWQAQALFCLLLRKADRSGVIELGPHGKRGVCAHVKMPWEVAGAALEELLSDGCMVFNGDRLVVRNFIAAQELEQVDAHRQREARARRREQALANGASPEEARRAARPDRYGPSPFLAAVTDPTLGHVGPNPGHVGPDLGHSIHPSIHPSIPSRVPRGSGPAEPSEPTTPAACAAEGGCSGKSGEPEGRANGRAKGNGAPVSQDAHDVAQYLLEAIRSHHPQHRVGISALHKWTKAIDLAISCDGRTPAQLRLVIDFAHRSCDEFWRSRLLSGDTLRNEFDRLHIRATSGNGSSATAPRPSANGAVAGSVSQIRQCSKCGSKSGAMVDDRGKLLCMKCYTTPSQEVST